MEKHHGGATMLRMTLAIAAEVAIEPASKTHDESRNGEDVGAEDSDLRFVLRRPRRSGAGGRVPTLAGGLRYAWLSDDGQLENLFIGRRGPFE